MSGDAAWFWRAILDHVAHPIFIKDRDFRFVFVNRALGDLVQRAPDDMLGKTDYDFFPPQQADFFREKDRLVFQGAPVSIDEERLTDAAGGEHVLATTKVPMRDGQGEVTHLVGIIHDITLLKRFQAQVERLKDDFLSVVSHELRAPLTNLQLLQGLLKNQVQAGAQGPALMGLVQRQQRSLDRLRRLVTDILDTTRIEQGKLSIAAREVDLLALARDAVDRAEQSFGERHQFALRAEGEALRVYADPDRLDQVLSNLLSNACKFAPEGTTVEVAVRQSGAEAEVEVCDRGPGIPAEQRERIFERFYQGGKSPGLGLGLYICNELVKAGGGRLVLRSTGEAGSCFLFTVPLGGGGGDGGTR